MPVLIEKDLTPTLPLNHARIGYDDVAGEYSATSSASDSPAVAAKSWQTFERWRPTSSPATLTKTFDSTHRIDYVGIGASTLSRADSLTVELLLDGVWQEVELTKGLGDHPTLDLGFAEQEFGIWEPVPDNEAVMILLTPRNGVGGVRITVEYIDEAPSVGKLAAGQVLTMHRPFYQGHSPAVLAADVTRTPSVSQGGEWLGNTIIRQGRSTQMSWQNLPAPWVRRNLSGKRGLIEHAVRLPFFVAWNPLQFRDCLYAQSEGAPQKPNNAGPRDLQSWQLDVKAYSDGSEPVTTPVVHKDYDEIVTHTRSSEGTYWDETRTFRIAEEDEPRFTHDPETGEAQGLLVEGEAVNRFTAFKGDGSFGSVPEFTANGATSPEGTETATVINEVTTGARRYRSDIDAGEFSSGQKFCFSWFQKRLNYEGTGRQGAFISPSNPINLSVDVDVTKLFDVGDGWERWYCVVSLQDGAEEARFRGYFGGVGFDTEDVVGVTDPFAFWGLQFEEGEFPTSAIKTDGTPATRAADVVSAGEVEKWLNADFFSLIIDAVGVARPGSGGAILGSNSRILRFLSVNSEGVLGNDCRDVGGANVSGDLSLEDFGGRAVVIFESGNVFIYIGGELYIENSYVPSELRDTFSEFKFGRRGTNAGDDLLSCTTASLKVLPYALTEEEARTESML